MSEDLPLSALIPPAKPGTHTFFRDAARFPFEPEDARFNLRTAWWMADKSFLAYSSEAAVREAYRSAGLTVEITPFGETYEPLRMSTQCYVVVADEWIVLAIRGTQLDRFFDFVRDWTVNLQLVPRRDGDHQVHSGFLDALNQVWGKARDTISRVQQRRLRPLWLTGHSLGAALATIALKRCAAEPNQLGVKGLYTFGSPRVGDAAFGASLPAPVYRFRNNLDAIPHVPLPPPYRHTGQLYYIDGDGRLHLNPGTVMELMLEARIEARRLLTAAFTGDLHAKIPAVFADHAPINYARLIYAAFRRSTP